MPRNDRYIRRDWYVATDENGDDAYQLREDTGYSKVDVSNVYFETPVLAEADGEEKAEARSERAFLEHINARWEKKNSSQKVVYVMRMSETVYVQSERLIWNDSNQMHVFEPLGTIPHRKDWAYRLIIDNEPSFLERFTLVGNDLSLRDPGEFQNGSYSAHRARPSF